MGQIDQLLRRVAGAPVRTVLLWRSRGISWKVITSNLLPVPSLYIKHHQLLPSRAGNGGRYHSMLVFEHLSNLMSGFGKRLGALSLYVQGDFDCTAFVNQNIAKGATDPWVSLAY